jgi:phage baseplate assembly protein W
MSTLEKNLYKRVSVSSSQSSIGSQGIAYRGFSTADITRDSFNLYDLELIKQDIINHFHIRQGEKLSDPNFGTIIWDVLFEQLTPEIEEAIINNVTEIINYDPRVTAQQVFVSTYESGIQIEATIEYLPYNIQETLEFKFDQSANFTD